MKEETITVYVTKDLEVRYVKEMPVNPEFKGYFFLHYWTQKQYEEAIESAKQESIPFESHNDIFFRIQDDYMPIGTKHFELNPNTFYQIQGQVERVSKPDCKMKSNSPPSLCGSVNNCDCKIIEVARLIESPSKETLHNEFTANRKFERFINSGLYSKEETLPVTNKSMTLEECKEEIAKRSSYGSWNYLRSFHKVDGVEIYIYMGMAAELYASQFKQPPLKEPKLTEDIIREIASIAWKGAANAHRLYPENSHTFVAYWDAAKNQFKEFNP